MSHTIHGTQYIYTGHVGKYTSPMDGMGVMSASTAAPQPHFTPNTIQPTHRSVATFLMQKQISPDKKPTHQFSSWWFEPMWKIFVKMGIFPREGWK